MRRFYCLFALVPFLAALLFLCSCGASPELKQQARLNEARSRAFVTLIADGKTNREQEQEFARQAHAAFSAFRESLGLTAIEPIPLSK